MDLNVPLILAQAVPVDPLSWVGGLTVYGPLGFMVMLLIWHVGRLEKRIDEMREAHRIEIAAERALNANLVAARLEDHKLLIPLSSNMVTVMQMERKT